MQNNEEKTFYGGCHCGAVKFQFTSCSHVKIWVCNCSICRLNDYQHLFIAHTKFALLKGKKSLISYKFGTKIAEHWFCQRCGIKSFYKPRSHPDSVSVNLRCVIDPPGVSEVIDFDGRNHEEAMKNSQHFL